MNFKAKYYTIQCVSVLYKNVKHSYEESFMDPKNELTIEEVKYQFAIYNLLDSVILKFDKKLLEHRENDILKVKLTEYQGYFLSVFLFENRKKYEGIAEQTYLNTFATKIDKEL